MKMFLSCVFLCSAIVIISYGTHINNIIFTSIGGAFVGGYIAMIHKQD